MLATCIILLIEFYELLFMKSDFKLRMSLHRRQLAEVLDNDLMTKSEVENPDESNLYQDSAEHMDAFEFPLHTAVLRGIDTKN